MVNVCPLCKKVLSEGEECGCMSAKLDPKQKAQRAKAAKAITGMGASTPFFVIVLFYTMSVFFNALSSGISYFGMYGSLMARPGGVVELAGGAYLLQTVLFLLALAPSVLICAGLWVLFFASRDPNGKLITPLYVVKGAVMAQFSIIFLLILVMEAALAVSLWFVNIDRFALSDRLTGGLSQFYIGLVILLVAGIAVLLVFYLINIQKTLDMAIKTLRTGQRWGDVPTFLIVMNYSMAALNLVSAAFEVSRGNGAEAVSAICAAAFLAGMAAALSTVRKSL